MRNGIGALVLGLGFLAAPVFAADPEGWSIARDGKACVATGSQSGNATVSIAVMPPQFLLFFESPDFPVEQKSHAVSLRIADGADIAVEALGSDHVYGIAITPPIGIPLRTAASVELRVEQKSYRFTIVNAAAAMDEVAHCAGVKPLPEQWSNAPRSVPDAPGWQLFENLPGANACSVRRNGVEVNTSLALTKDGTLILVAGRPDWAKWGGEIKGSLQIDGAAAQDFVALGFQNVVMWPVKDPAVVARLKPAKSFVWHLPWGDFHAEVAGLGTALEALKACKPTPPGQ